jgi:P-type conjugative transfer protein TrbJ
MKKCFLIIAVSLIVVLPAPRAEAIVVYDPTNYSANIQTSLKQVESVVNELKMLENQAKQLLSLGQIPELQQLKSTFSQLMKIRNEAESLLNSYSKFQEQWDSTFRDYASVSGMSATEWATQAQKMLDESNRALYDSVKAQTSVSQIESDAQALTALQNASQNAQGVLQAMQAGNQIGATTAQQLMRLQSIMAASNTAQATYYRELHARDEKAAAEGKRFFAPDYNVQGGGGLDKW